MGEVSLSQKQATELAEFDHPDHPEGAVVVRQQYPQDLRNKVILNCFDDDIKDGDSYAVYSFRYDEIEGEIFDGNSELVLSGETIFWEIYPPGSQYQSLLVYRHDSSIDELSFLQDAVLQTLGVTAD